MNSSQNQECLKNQLQRSVALANVDRKMLAEIATELASCELSMPTPKVVEISPGEHLALDGFALQSAHEIHVRFRGKCGCEIAKIAAHESKHREQNISGKFSKLYACGESEPDADSFASAFVARHELKTKCSCYRKPVIVFSPDLRRLIHENNT